MRSGITNTRLALKVARSLTGVGGGGAPLLDIRARVGTSTSPTSTGLRAVTGVGFQPKCVLSLASHNTANVVTAGAAVSFGAAVSAVNEFGIGFGSVSGVTTSATHRRHDNDTMHSIVFNNSVLSAAALSSLDVDGFTRNFSVVDGALRILNYIALGGADLEVALTQHQMNGTNASQSFAHGLSGTPTALLFLSAMNTSVPAATSTILSSSIGFWSASGQLNASVNSSHGVTTSLTRRLLSQSVWAFLSASTGNLLRRIVVDSVNATNVDISYPTAIDASQRYFYMLAIRGAKCQVGTFNCAGSTSPLTISTTGITPKLFMPIFIPSGVTSIGSVQNDLLLTIGACDGTNNVSCGITDINGLATTNARRYQSSTSLVEYNSAGSLRFEATASFSGESVIISPTTNLDSVRGQGAYLVIGS